MVLSLLAPFAINGLADRRITRQPEPKPTDDMIPGPMNSPLRHTVHLPRTRLVHRWRDPAHRIFQSCRTHLVANCKSTRRRGSTR
jgi:hypothetical protein